MKRIYSSLKPAIEQKSYADWITKCDQKLSVSSKGLLAFTCSFCLNQRRPISTAHHVYVADINTPYQPYLLVDSEYEFTIVEWDPSGTKLLVCDIRGSATIYTSTDYLISDWQPYFKKVFAAETFLTAAWYNPGLVSTINVASQNLKNPANHLEYSDKIQQTKFGASLRMFGGKPAEGCVLISKTGLVCCLTLMTDGTVDVAIESLAPLRTRVEVADICHCSDGSFVVGTSAGSINSTILLYQLDLSMDSITIDDVDMFSGACGRRIKLQCRPFTSFHLNIMAQILNERENSSSAFEKVAHIKFVTRDSPNELLVEICGENLSLIELWKLDQRKTEPIHSVILDAKNSQTDVKPSLGNNRTSIDDLGHTTTCKDWSFKGNYITDKDLITIQTPKFKLFGSNRQLNIILLAYKDSTICCMRKEDLQPLDESIDLSSIMTMGYQMKTDNDGSPYKVYQGRNSGGVTNGSQGYSNNSGNSRSNLMTKVNGSNGRQFGRLSRPILITDMQFSANQSVLIAIDSLSQLHAIKLPPLVNCQDTKDHETYLQYILEYSLVTGNDWWDAMVCADQQSIESICDKFHDAYERQPKHIQKKYFNRQLMIRASLYRCLNNVSSLCKASDCHVTIMLNSISSTLKSNLRSQNQDDPSENLANHLRNLSVQQQTNSAQGFNCNDVISRLNEKEFFVESQLVQCLQPLIQWTTDLAIYLVVSSRQRLRSGLQFPGAGLAQNKEALECLRELLVIIKIWGSQNEACMPNVHRLNDQVDVLGTLFRLISMAHASLCNGSELSDSYIEECAQFGNSISVGQFSLSLEATGVASPMPRRQQNNSVSYSSTPKHAHHKQLSQQYQNMGMAGNNAGPNDGGLILEYFREPAAAELVSLPKVEGAINMYGSRKIDVVRNISLGAHPQSNLRQCTRCKSVSLIKHPSFQTTRAWEQRWISSCVCGGSWAQSDCSLVNKLNYLARLRNSNTNLAAMPHAHQLAR